MGAGLWGFGRERIVMPCMGDVQSVQVTSSSSPSLEEEEEEFGRAGVESTGVSPCSCCRCIGAYALDGNTIHNGCGAVYVGRKSGSRCEQYRIVAGWTRGRLSRSRGWGLARVRDVVQIRSHRDLTAVLGNNLKGLGLDLPKSIAGDQALKRLCAEVNLDLRLVELGHLILFNLEFLTK